MTANITLKRDAPFRGGFEGLLFFQLRWLRQSSVTGAPLSFTLGRTRQTSVIIMHQVNYRAVVASSWTGMLSLLLAMLLLEPLRFAMSGQYESLSALLRTDPGPLRLKVLVAMLCLNTIVQVTVHARSCRTAKISILALSVLYGLFFFAHNVVHLLGGEQLGLQSLLDVTHHVLAVVAIWGAWRWQSAA
ncbi:MAG: hypothetical protein ABTQ26_04995 [Azonexus sp.]